MDFSFLSDPSALSALAQVVMIDLVLAADNAIIIGALAAGLPPADRRKVIMMGMVAALVLRIAFALIVVQLLDIHIVVNGLFSRLYITTAGNQGCVIE